MVCQVCDGMGWVGNRNIPCPECNGTGSPKPRFLIDQKATFAMAEFLSRNPHPAYRLVSVVFLEKDLSYELFWEIKE